MKKKTFIFIIFINLLVIGCSYKVQSNISPAVNVYSSYNDKIPGVVVLIMDNSIYNINRDLRPSTLLCGAHRFPITIDQQLAISIRKTTEYIFKGVIIQKFMPTKDQLENLNCNLVLLVKLKKFDSNLRFFPGLWSSEAVATCNLVLEITAKNSNNNILLVTTAGGDRTAERNAGNVCKGGAIVLGEAVNKTIEETMERYAEKISNSRIIRNSFAGQSHR